MNKKCYDCPETKFLDTFNICVETPGHPGYHAEFIDVFLCKKCHKKRKRKHDKLFESTDEN